MALFYMLVHVLSRVVISVQEPCADATLSTFDIGARTTESNSLLIGVVGDWGVINPNDPVPDTNLTEAYLITESLSQYMDIHPVQFIINQGDNFYNDGIDSLEDERWNISFNKLFGESSAYFYSVLGNHDWKANADAYLATNGNASYATEWDIGTKTQIEYTSSEYNHLHTWCLPHYYYTFSYNVNHKFSIRFIALDTQSMLQYEYDGCQEDKETGELSDYCHGASTPDPIEQIQWFKETLFASTEDYVVVFSHHPLVSSGTLGLNTTLVDGKYCTWGFSGYPTMKQNVSKIIREYIEDKGDNILYLSGHSHLTQMFQSKTSNLMNMITGRMGRTNNAICGGQEEIDETYNVTDGIQWNVKYAHTKSAFGTVLFEEHAVTLQYHGVSSGTEYTDNVLYSQTIQYPKMETTIVDAIETTNGNENSSESAILKPFLFWKYVCLGTLTFRFIF